MVHKQLKNRLQALALFVALVLLMTAFAKLSYPMRFQENLQIAAGIFEILFAILLLIFYARWQMWLAAACVFALWGGYSLFWLFENLPCGCMGELYLPPTIVTTICDLIFCLLSLYAALALGVKRAYLYAALVVSVVLSISGYFMAQRVLAEIVSYSRQEVSQSATDTQKLRKVADLCAFDERFKRASSN